MSEQTNDRSQELRRVKTAIGVFVTLVIVATVCFIATSATSSQGADAGFGILGLFALLGAVASGVYTCVVAPGSGSVNARLVGFVIAAVVFVLLVVVTLRSFGNAIDGN